MGNLTVLNEVEITAVTGGLCLETCHCHDCVTSRNCIAIVVAIAGTIGVVPTVAIGIGLLVIIGAVAKENNRH